MLRLNMLNPAHVNINKVLSELDMDIFKSKNQFFIDAATYYIEHFGREALTEPKEKKEHQFISTEEMAGIEERIRQEAREEARAGGKQRGYEHGWQHAGSYAG